jgi:NADH-quinone oxidoreductase subunit N
MAATDPFRHQPLLALGLILILIGFAFKVAAVPFHMWAPDVYEGAPTPVTGFMAVGVKAAAFVALLRIVMVGLGAGDSSHVWLQLLSALAVLTIVVGNVLALVQQNVKRMLAYSSIAHAGYAMIGVVVAGSGYEEAGAAVLFYLTTYTFMTLGAFGVLTFLERRDGSLEAERFGAFAGIGFKHPAVGIAMSLFMVSLAGLPPTGGFFGKLYLFSAAVKSGAVNLALIGILGSIISVYYYLRVIVAFYMKDAPDPGPTPQATHSRQLTLGLILAALGVLCLGIVPGWWIEFGQTAIRSLITS